jgi:hypothetical protein
VQFGGIGVSEADKKILSESVLTEDRCALRNRFCLKEMQLFIDTICLDLLRFEHSADSEVSPEQVVITQEVYLGSPGAFADMRVCAPGVAPYFVEVKCGSSRDYLLRTIIRKYGRNAQIQPGVSKLLLVISVELAHDWSEIESELKGQLHPVLMLEVWDEQTLLTLLRGRFQVEATSLGIENVDEVRSAIDHAKGQYAFGTEFRKDPVHETLLWHSSFWLLHELRTRQRIECP